MNEPASYQNYDWRFKIDLFDIIYRLAKRRIDDEFQPQPFPVHTGRCSGAHHRGVVCNGPAAAINSHGKALVLYVNLDPSVTVHTLYATTN